MQRLQEHAVGIAVNDALHRRARVIADRVGQFVGRHLGLLGAGHELPGNRIVRHIAAIDQRQHLRCERDRHGLGSLRQARIGRHQAFAFQVLEFAQGRHGVREIGARPSFD
jgi:hypothetical protein